MAKSKWTVQAFILLGLRAVFLTPGDEVGAAQYNTSAPSSWIQLEADDSFAGRNGEGSPQVAVGQAHAPPNFVFEKISVVRTKSSSAWLRAFALGDRYSKR